MMIFILLHLQYKVKILLRGKTTYWVLYSVHLGQMYQISIVIWDLKF